MTTSAPFATHAGFLHHQTQQLCCSRFRGSKVLSHRTQRSIGHLISANKPPRRHTGAACTSAASVTERYEEAEAKNPIRPLRHPFASWQHWWYIGKPSAGAQHQHTHVKRQSAYAGTGATPQSQLPQSQKFSRICARLWGIMKHSKTSLSFAVTFMVSSTAPPFATLPCSTMHAGILAPITNTHDLVLIQEYCFT